MTARQPGLAFVTPATVLDEALPRMDIACFTGFAARGPVHVPIAVDSPAQYDHVFGNDLPLVWDAENGEVLHAHLGPAVRAFFANGGRRAWVIRVADNPRSNRFPVPGLCRVLSNGRLLPAHLSAATPGSWSDGLQLASSVELAPVSLRNARLQDGQLQLDLQSATTLQPGDLLQAEWGDGRIAFIPYAGTAPVDWQTLRWFRQPTLPSRARDGFGRLYRAGYRHRFPLRASLEWAGNRPVLEAELAADRAPQPGETLKMHLGSAEYWLQVEACESGKTGTLIISGSGLRRLHPTPAAWPGEAARLTRVRLNLHPAENDRPVSSLRGLGFCPAHPNALVKLASDTLSGRRNPNGTDTPSSGTDIQFLPLGLGTVPGPVRGPIPRSESQLTRDGLRRFGAHLFIDPALAGTGTQELADAADRIRYTGDTTRPLRGLHAAFGIEEATLLCVPDAVHRPWQRIPGLEHPVPAPSEPLSPPANACPAGTFNPCLPRRLPAPMLTAEPADANGAVRLLWSGGPPEALYILEEARDRQWRDAVEIHRGEASAYTVRDRQHGDYFYRVRLQTVDSYSDWSTGLAVRIDPAAGWKIDEASDYRDTDLLAIQRALVRLAAARGDCLAVLALPRHFRTPHAVAHGERLKGSAPSFFETGAGDVLDVPALNARESTAWSYAALYHPWLHRLADSPAAQYLPALPPDGPVTGLIARHALRRGAWIAPANDVLEGIIALDSPFFPDDAQLAAAINPIVRDGLRFMLHDALTLSEQNDTQPINVRRLMSLLRRLALQQGAQFVFEPNSDALRRTIDARFGHWLATLFARGAFAGKRPQEAFRLRVGSDINTAQSIDAGRLIIEIAVAPAQPMRFLTVRLVQTGEHFSASEA